MQTPIVHQNEGRAGASALDATLNESEPRGNADPRAMSVIGADIVITGNIEASVDLHLEGKVIGDVRCATLILGEDSSVTGRVYATRVKVSGIVDGAIETRDLVVEASARVTGEITYERLRVANGGVLEGTMTRKVLEESSDDSARLKLVEPAKKSKRDVGG